MTKPILPGSTIGILGGGQLGRMLAIAAKQMGYGVIIYAPEHSCIASKVADRHICSQYNDMDALKDFGQAVDVVTLEFENIPQITLEAVSKYAPIRPSVHVLRISQHRLKEKTFLSSHHYPVPKFHPVKSIEDLNEGVEKIQPPCVLKTATMGYDGKGQAKIDDEQGAVQAYDKIGWQESILEEFVTLKKEVSVIGARNEDGDFVYYGPVENDHQNHILFTTTAPAVLERDVNTQCIELTRQIGEQLDYVGVFCVEYFITETDRVLINEIAPRPHNSGHYTIDACQTSQFEQQLRAVCGLPFGSTEQHTSAVMLNLMGELWENGAPDWTEILKNANAKLHLYEKDDARAGRKMGHITILNEDPRQALQLAKTIQARLLRGALETV